MPITSHERLPRPLKQVKFQDKTSRRRPARKSLPLLTKSQSTLTQIDFYSSPPASSRGPRWDDSDFSQEEEIEVKDDSMEDRPAKRRKRVSKKKDQSTTCTQLRRRGQDTGSDGDTDEVRTESPRKRGLRRSRRARAVKEATPEDDVQHLLDTQLQGDMLNHQMQHTDSIDMQAASTSSSQRSKKTSPNASSPAKQDDSTRPSTATSIAQPATPPKIKKTEIPSSQTPSSITLSKHNREWDELQARSPLKEKSCNLPTTKPSPDFDRPETFEHIDLDIDRSGEESAPEGGLNQPNWTGKLAMTPKKQVKHKNVTLPRTATVADSEADSMELDYCNQPFGAASQQQTALSDEKAAQDRPKLHFSGSISTIPDSEADSLELTQSKSAGQGRTMSSPPAGDPDKVNVMNEVAQERPVKTPRTFARVTTIQESESESELEGIEDDLPQEDEYDVNELNDHDETLPPDSEMYEQNTYDPVAAALERDAARYGKTGTQILAESHPASRSQYYHTQPANLNVGAVEEVDELNLPNSQNTQIVVSSQPEEVEIVKASQEEFPSDPTTEPPSAGGQGMATIPVGQTSVDEHRTTQIPLTSGTQTQRRRLQARASQVSTVVPTQFSRSASVDDTPSSSQQASQQPARNFDTISSSPFPLPPWGSSQMPQMRNETQDSLIDWSLPPPPPLPPSSVRQETTSSL